MPHTIAIFPKFDGLDKVSSIMKKYNSSCNDLKPHIALVYYFDKKSTRKEVNEVVMGFSSFEIRLDKIRASFKNNYIFLDVTRGKEKIAKLKDMLYKGLGLEWKGDFLYKPHITLGNFKTKKAQKVALGEIKDQKLDFSCKIDSFVLMGLIK
jgi:2'-5' RNA ligase